MALLEEAIAEDELLTPGQVLDRVRRLGIHTPAESATFVRADRDSAEQVKDALSAIGTLDEASAERMEEAMRKSRSCGREIRIRNFRSDRLDLVDDLIVEIEERGGQYVANSYDTGQYGYGPSPDDAIQHLCSVIEDYYGLLKEDEGRLSQPLQAHWRYLRSILRERR